MASAERRRFTGGVSGVQVVAENDGWSISIPGVPVAADGTTLDDAADEMLEALREYAEAWADHLRPAPNHAENRDLARFVAQSSDADLHSWLLSHAAQQ